MKFMIGLMATVLGFTSSAFASDIFVRDARGNLTSRQVADVTGLVKNAVRSMSEHTLVRSANKADFILQPSVVQRGDDLVLRVEKQRNGEILSMSEERISSVNASKSRAMAVTETVLADSSYGAAYATDDDGKNGTSSATSSSASDIDRVSDQDVAPNASGAVDVTSPASSRSERSVNSSASQSTGVSPTARSSGPDASVGELTAASPRMLNPDRFGQVQLGVGPSFAINMKEDSLMYDLMAAYAVDFSENFVGKVFGDFNLATGSSVTRFINLGLAGEYYPTRELLTFGKPYLAADLGYAFTRDALNRNGEGLAAGVGAGFKFQAAEMNWDIAAHYTALLERVADENPSVFGVRVALGF
jgi:hypothetical protein